MAQTRSWPSRRMQLTIIALLVMGAILTVAVPPISKEKRAERLYHDAWFASGFPLTVEGPKTEQAIPRLERALKLSPGNDLYEQALVWHYPKGELSSSVQNRQLGENARRLAAGLIHDYDKKQNPSEDPALELKRLDTLLAADPGNALVHYRRAFVLLDMGEIEEAIREVRLGNKAGVSREYIPDVSSTVADSIASPLFVGLRDSVLWRRTARALTREANDRLRQGRVDEAREILEDCVEMGIVVSSTEPAAIITFLVARAIFAISSEPLGSIYKDFGMTGRVEALQGLEREFDRGLVAARAHTSDTDSGAIWQSILRRAVAFVITAPAVVLSAALMVLGFLGWLIAHIVRRRSREPKLVLAPWAEGWMARVFLAVWIPVFAAVVTIIFVKPSVFVGKWDVPHVWGEGANVVLLLTLIAQFLVLGLALRVMHHRYDEHTGERTSVFRFIFKSCASAKAWMRKYLIAAVGAQIVFIACCFLLATIIYRPVFDMHPWQLSRTPMNYFSQEQALVDQINQRLKQASLTEADETIIDQ